MPALKAVEPSIVKPSKPKFLISGKAGVGKSLFAMDFPAPYYIDTESGATRGQYVEKLKKSGGVYMGKEQGSQDFKVVLEEIKALATTPHKYKTLVIDSYSKLYNLVRSEAEETGGSEFGRDKKEANKPSKQLIKWMDRIPMTVILICHSADKWVRRGKDIYTDGTTFDGYDKLEFDLDLWIEAVKEGKNRSFLVRKSRIDAFVESDKHALEYSTFAKLYGEDVIKSDVSPMKMASPEQVAEAKRLVELVKIDEAILAKWNKTAEADTWEDYPADKIEQVINFINKKISGKETNNVRA